MSRKSLPCPSIRLNTSMVLLVVGADAGGAVVHLAEADAARNDDLGRALPLLAEQRAFDLEREVFVAETAQGGPGPATPLPSAWLGSSNTVQDVDLLALRRLGADGDQEVVLLAAALDAGGRRTTGTGRAALHGQRPRSLTAGASKPGRSSPRRGSAEDAESVSAANSTVRSLCQASAADLVAA